MNLEVDAKPSLLSSSDKLFTHSLTDATKHHHHHQRRRRCSSSSSSADAKLRDAPTRLNRAQSISHAAAETYLVTRLSFILLRYLGVGYRWITRLIALGCYALLLMPGFLQVAYYYFFSSQVRRSVVYGDQPRNRLDLFLPANSGEPKPVVIFVTGGAWIIGYKAWGSLLGQQLAERDIIVACIDYRNFPQGTIGDMVEDTSQGISFVCNHLTEYGGDPNRIYLMGQSAGAHISACALLEQAIKESEPEKGESITWSVSQLKAYFGLSGGYNLPNLVDHFNNRGLYRSIFLSIMEGEQGLQRFSPEVQIQDKSIRDAVSRLPPITLFHGTSDYSIPSDASKTFVDALQRAGAQAKLVLYEGKTHTDLFLQQGGLVLQSNPQLFGHSMQDPLRGGKDELFDHLVSVIHAGDKEALDKDAMAPPRRRLVPEFLLKLARKISPF
ncbi:probable isoprenylcysteine alpha-carbonyl methylesterase ICMEL2 isoform X1 [Quercus lobata]|uniref:probable isoprenylcysteine alpha-carbonyl methylesterase ICMEL2 isoform X1 n=1 Tax=Quercus lobata TaxID=97700 RepID=UPI00124585F9|nr:probable isoprenylcysteine alpha-carbonyl methylesterase ICMEL2 isoform X1 [Quercus lobata]